MLEDSEVFIHIGLPKTATSFFQKIVFPKIPNIKLIATPYTQYNTAFNMLQYADDTIYDENIFKDELDGYRDFKKILISEESLSGSVANLIGINRSQNAHRLKNVLPNARIILFLRGQKSILYSVYNQYIKTHYGTRRMGQFFRFHNLSDFYFTEKERRKQVLPLIHFLPHHSHLDLFKYYNLIKLYKSLFKNVDVFLYEDFCIDPQNTISRLENILNESIPELQLQELTGKTNSSLTKKELEKKIFYNKVRFILRSRNVANCFYFIHKIKYNNSFLNKENEFLQKTIQDYYEEDNKKIIHEFPEIKLKKHPKDYSA